MALSRIDGPDDLYVGGIFALRRPAAMEERNVTHILSMIKYSFVQWKDFQDKYVHFSVDIDDVEDEDILRHLSKAVRFIEAGLSPTSGFAYPEGTEIPSWRRRMATAGEKETKVKNEDEDAITPATLPDTAAAELANLALDDDRKPAGVFVHCAMGKSRSVTAVIAYLLWKYPFRYGLTPRTIKRPDEETAEKVVLEALKWVRKTREMAEPNPGFMKQIQMWVQMGMPADSDDAVEKNGTYQRWLWEREVEESARIGRAPDWIRFEDEVAEEDQVAKEESDTAEENIQLRCKKCRKVLATEAFIVPHQTDAQKKQCPQRFVEPLSWMRPFLDQGVLEGRLVCPNAKCGASVGRYSWKGFKCACGEWVCPAFSLQAAKVDEVKVANKKPDPSAANGADPRTALGIRLPPGGRRQNL